MGFLGLLSTVRELMLPEATQQKLNLHNLLTLSWPWYVWVLAILAVLLFVVFEGAYAAVSRREQALADGLAAINSERQSHERTVIDLRDELASLKSADEPDILLDYNRVDGFKLDNPEASAAARDIRIETLTTGEYISGQFTYAGETNPIITPAMLAEFLPVGYLDKGTSTNVTAACREAGPRNRPATFADFLDVALKKRRFEDEQNWTQKPIDSRDGEAPLVVLDRQLGAAHAKTNYLLRPLEIVIKVSYRNWAGTRQWQRIETLHYEPDSLRAYVGHGERSEVADQG